MPINSKNIFEIALDSVNQGVVIYDNDLTVIGFNRHALEILDMPADRFSIGEPFLNWVRYTAEHGGYGGQGPVEARIEQRMAIVRTLLPYRSDSTRSDGKTVELIGNPIPGIGYITVYSDVTERVAAQKMVQDSEKRFKDFAELGSDWFWEMGPDLRFTYHSPRYFEITGFLSTPE